MQTLNKSTSVCWVMSNQNFALLLSGGGARAAYQAGILRGIASYCKEQP